MLTSSVSVHERFASRKIHPTFGLEISGLDVSEPLDAETVSMLLRLSAEYKLLLFKGQSLTTETIERFAQHFGDTKQIPQKTPEQESVKIISVNLEPKGKKQGRLPVTMLLPGFGIPVDHGTLYRHG